MDPVCPLHVERHSPRLADLLPSEAPLERVVTGFRFTEGPLWDPRTRGLLFSDIPSNRIGGERREGEPEGGERPGVEEVAVGHAVADPGRLLRIQTYRPSASVAAP